MKDVRLEPMTEEQYGPWRTESQAHYAQSVAASGVPEPDAAEEATETFGRLLPDGLATPGNHLWYAYDGDERVGFLWMKVTERATGDTAFVYNIAVEEGLRRKGYGRAIMVAGERWCRDRGTVKIGLHVFAHNPGARTLYERLGYVETSRNMAKTL